MAIVHLSKDNFKEEVLESKVPVGNVVRTMPDNGTAGGRDCRRARRYQSVQA
jgi:hypothetical protein